MAKIVGTPTVKLEVTITLTEEEAGALDALFGYDVEPFLKTFYKEMGEAYLKPYEAGLRSLHASRGFLSGALEKAKKAREVFKDRAKVIKHYVMPDSVRCAADVAEWSCSLEKGHYGDHVATESHNVYGKIIGTAERI